MIARRTFKAMGTEVELLLEAASDGDAEPAFDRAEGEFARLEARLSRFQADSELSALNREGAIVAGDDLLAVTRLAVAARERTGGLFDPTIHNALVGAGYDRTFEEITPNGEAADPRPCGGEVRIEGNRIELEDGFRLDLGGIAKGYAVDRAAAIVAERGPALVNAGGDIAARGRLWPVGVETGDGGQITLGLEDAAVATSGRDRRRWRRGGEEAHHLIDPSTGSPARSEYLRVTVSAPTAVDAEVLAKAVFLGAPPEGPAVLVTADGRTVLAGGLG